MKLEIKDIIDKHKGQKAIVIGHGPSLDIYKNKLVTLKEKGYILYGCNTWYEFYPDSSPHYWINVNNEDDCENLMPFINKYKSVWIYADSVDLTEQTWVDKNIQTDYLPYDQRHFYGHKCGCCDTYNCKKYFNPNRLTLQEELKKYTEHSEFYNSCHTVVMHSIAFSILMGVSEIYLIGLDFDYRKGYASNSANRKVAGNDFNYFDLNNYGGDILDAMKIISDSANKVNTKIFNANPNSNWKMFEYKEIS